MRSYSSQNFSYVNGTATSSLALQIVMIAEAEGTFTLGPAFAGSGDDAARSDSVTIVVTSAGSSAPAPRFGGDADAAARAGDDLVVLGQVDDREPWVNEQITYTFTFLRRVRVLEGSQYTPPSTTGFWVEALDTTEPREVVLEGKRYIAERVRVALFPTGPGQHTIGEAYLKTTIQERGRGRRDPFDLFGGDPFGLFGGGREIVLQTEPITVQVRPLPVEGKPVNFCGAVGKFTLQGSADRTDVKAGEPVTLTLKLEGEGNVKGVSPLDLDSLEGFKVYESKAEETSRAVGDKIVGTKRWEYVLVPTSGGDVEIPAIELSVFDPKAEAYVPLATAAIPLRVEATGMDEALARGGDPSLAKERVRLRERDIRYVKPAGRDLRRGGTSPWTRPENVLAHVAPVLAFVGSVAIRRHRDRLRHDTRYARRRGAVKSAQKRLEAAESSLSLGRMESVFGEASSALRGYVADRLHLAAANLEAPPVRAGLEAIGLPNDEIESFFAMLDACDGARFSPLGSDASAAGDLVQRARRWISATERCG
jgi:hypothetical protein